jgi:uncharacterized protein YndB with AHSA1/START domain
MSTGHKRTRQKDVVELERRIAAPPETVFSYFVDPEKYRRWQGVGAELDPRPGGLFRVTMTNRAGQVASGAYLEVEPPTRVVFTWGWEGVEGLPPGASTVEVLLERDGDGTLLRLRHGGLPNEAACQFHAWGWNLTLDRLVVAGEGGDPGPYPHADY